MLEEAKHGAPAYLDFPPSHRKRLRTNNVQERANREIKRRSRVVQVFPSESSLLVLFKVCRLVQPGRDMVGLALLLGEEDDRDAQRGAPEGRVGLS